MRNYVIINGVNSNTINGLGINELPPITKPQMRVQNEEIDGRDGDITTNLGYSAYDKTITIGLFGTGYDIDDIVAFFNGEGTIVFSNEADKYYNFKILNQIDYVALQKFKSASITFHCQPFKYPLTETPEEIDYDYIELEDVEIASISNTALSTMEIDLLGNTSQTGTPTPDSPIPVNVVSGDNEVVVCGKNIVSSYSRVGNQVYLNGSTSTTDYIFKAGTYTISYKNNTNNTAYVFMRKPSSSGNENVDSGSPVTFTSNEDFNVWIYMSGMQDGDISEVQLEKSATPTTYEPYTSQTYPINLPVENLLNLTDGTYTNNDITAVVENGEITLNGSNTSNAFIIIPISMVVNGTYTISANNSSTNVNVSPRFDNNALAFNCSDVNATTTATFNTDTTFTQFVIRVQSGSSLTNFVIKPQLEKGSKANSFTPYGTTPIEMCNIPNTTYKDGFAKNSGKNLIDIDNSESGGINSSGELVDNPQNWRTTEYIKVKPNTNYTFSNNIGLIMRLYEYDSSKTFIPPRKEIENNATTFTITTGATTEYLKWTIFKTITLTKAIVESYQLQIEEGQATTYEPYGTGLWCKYNAIGKVVLDGSEEWTQRNTGDGSTTISFNRNISGIGSTSQMNNRFPNSTGSTDGNEGLGIPSQLVQLYIQIKRSRLSSIDVTGFRSWLASNNTTVYYILSTPYLSLIEDNNLIEQLDNLQNAMSYTGTTNISQVNNDLPFLLDLKVLELGSDEAVINNTGNVYSKPLIALEGTGIVNVYLNNNQIFQVDMTDNNKINIDIEKLEAYNPDDNTLMNRKITGDISKFIFNPGNNTVKIDGLLIKATISNFVRWL